MTIQLVSLFIAAFVNLILGYGVFIKNPRSVTNKSFFGLTIAFAAWSIANYLSVQSLEIFSQITTIRIVMFSAAWLNFMAFFTLSVFPDKTTATSFKYKWALYFTVFVSILTLTPLVFSGIDATNTETVSPIPGPGIVLFLLQTVVLIGFGSFKLFSKFRKSRGLTRLQLRYLLLGIVLSLSAILATNLIAVLIFNTTFFINFGPGFTLIFTSFAAYAIIKHRLLEIRAIVARSIAYALLLVTLLGGYIAVVIILGSLFFDANDTARTPHILYGALAVISAVIFQPLRSFFDKCTNRLFYQDAYDTQELFDKLNDILVSSLDVVELKRGVIDLVKSQLKLRFLELEQYPLRAVKPDAESQGLLKTFLTDQQKVVELDLIEDQVNGIKHAFIQADVAVVSKLKDQDNNILGLLIFGDKKSGNAFSARDLQIIDIISDEIAIALQNSLRYEEIKQFTKTLELKIEKATQ